MESSAEELAPTFLAAVEEVLGSFTNDLVAKSAKAYRKDLEHFASWRKGSTVRALAGLLKLSGEEGVAQISSWDVEMLGSGVSVATVRRRLSALRSFIKAAGSRGLTTWTLEIDAPPPEPSITPSSLRYGGILLATSYAFRTYPVDDLVALFGPGEITCETSTTER